MASPRPHPACLPTPVEEIAAALDRIVPLHGLPFEDRLWLARHGQEYMADTGDILFEEGAPAEHMILLLKGEIHVRRQHSGPMALFIGRTGQMTGLLPFSRMKASGGQGFAITPVWALLIHKSLFPDMLAGHPLHGAARGLHAARPCPRSHAHRAAIREARRTWQAGRQSGPRAQQSRLGRATRRLEPGHRASRQPPEPLQARQPVPERGAD